MLALILLWVVVYLSGILICKIGGEKETSHLWIHLTGFFFLIFFQGVVFFLAQLFGAEFSKGRNFLAVGLLITSLFSLLICRKEIGRSMEKIRKFRPEKKFHLSLLLWLFAGLLWIMVSQRMIPRTDGIAETAAITLQTNTLNQYHPFTHEPLHSGVILTRKVITLPFLYAAISSWTGWDPAITVRVAGTAICLIFSMTAFAYLGHLLFYGNKNHMYLLLILIEFLYLSGDYHPSMDAYRQLYQGYSGELITAMVLLPAVIITLYRLTGFWLREDFPKEKEGIEGGRAVLSLGLIFAGSLFLTTVTWGILMLFLAAALYGTTAGIILWMKREKKQRKKAGGKR